MNLASVIRITTQLLALIPLVTALVYFWHNALIPELAYNFCAKDDPTSLAAVLEQNTNDVVFVNFKYHRQRCYHYDDINHLWYNSTYRNAYVLDFNSSPHDHILLRFPYGWSPPDPLWLTSSPPFKIKLYKGTADNPYTVERDVSSSDAFDLQGVYFVERNGPEGAYDTTYALKPAPYSDDIVSQMTCLYRRWHWWQKRSLCFKL